jgi:hypothetical protein
MFKKIREMIIENSRANAVKKSPGRPLKVTVEPVTKADIKEPIQATKSKTKPVCVIEKHDCMAVQLTNRLICMIEEFEQNIDRIEKHPTLNPETKLDIQNYINKNLITALWAVSPAFELMKEHSRVKSFKTIFNKAASKGTPGILEEVKHV